MGTPSDAVAKRRAELLARGGQSLGGGQPSAVESRRSQLLAAGGQSIGAPGNGVSASAGGAALRGVGQGLTFGFGDEIGAGLQAGLAYLSGDPEMDPATVYREARRENRQQLAADMDQQPVASVLGNVAGGVVSGIATGGVGKGLGTLGQAALQGGVQGFGDSDADLLEGDVSGAVADAGRGAAFGVAAQKVGDRLGRLAGGAARSVQEGLENAAAVRAVKAAGAKQVDLKPLKPGELYEKGRALLDAGVIRPWSNAEGVADAIEPALAEAGADIGTSLRQADAAGAFFDLGDFLKRVEDDLIAPNERSPGVLQEIRALKQKVAEFRKFYPDGVTSFEDANRLKSDFANGFVNWGNHWNNQSPSKFLERLRKQFVGIFNDSIEQQIQDHAGAGVRASFEEAKERYGPLAWANQVAGRGASADAGNDFLSLKDVQAAQLAAQARAAANADNPLGNGLWGAAFALGSKFARERGGSTVALALDRASTSDLLNAVATAQPEALGEFAGVIANAVQRGSLPVTHHVLMQKSEAYRTLVEGLRKAE